jgi:hypothetical protein
LAADDTERPSEPHLYELDGESRREVALQREDAREPSGGFILSPAAPIAVGTRLSFEADPTPCDDGSALHGEFRVTEAAPLPTSLGTLQTSVHRGPLSVPANASCSNRIDAAYVDLSVSLAQAAQPFADVIVYGLVLDGAPAGHFRASVINEYELPRDQERVYVACETDPDVYRHDVPPGVHRARMRASLPDGTSLETDEVSFELRCDGVSADAGGGCAVEDARSERSAWWWVGGGLLALRARGARRSRRARG